MLASQPIRPPPGVFSLKIYNKAKAAPNTPRKPQLPISLAVAAADFDVVAAGAGAVPDGEPVAEEPDTKLVEEPEAELGEVDKTPDSSVPLALALSPVYLVAPTPVPFLHSPASADVLKVMSAHWRMVSRYGTFWAGSDTL